MPRVAKELSAIEVKRLKTGRHAVGGVSGLMLQVTDTGARSWILRTVVGSTRRDIGLGAFPALGVGEARKKAQIFKDQIAEGRDPVSERKAAKERLILEQNSRITFQKAADQFITNKAHEWVNPRSEKQWRSSLETYAFPHIGQLAVANIGLSEIKTVLDPIWTVLPETASRVRSRLENILGWCTLHGFRQGENPARWSGFLDQIYSSTAKVKRVKHHTAMPYSELPGFMAELRKRPGMAAKALEFLILTAARTNEVIGDKRIRKLGATWDEVDLQKAVWTIPAERMKGGKEHRVPLPTSVIDLLRSIDPVDGVQIFHSSHEVPSNNFLTALLKRMEVEVTAHGFRASFRTWAQECTAYADEVSELSLAHINSDATRAAYARSELIDIRRQLMADWAKFVLGKA